MGQKSQNILTAALKTDVLNTNNSLMKLFLIFELCFLLILIVTKLIAFPSLSEQSQNQLIQRWSVNFSFEILNRFLVLTVVFAFLPFLSFPATKSGVIYFIFYLLFLDFIFYWRHRFYHRWLWRIHSVHHSDQDYDFTLSLRIHPVETLIQLALFISISLLLNVSEWQFVLAAQIFTVQALLSHFERTWPSNWAFSVIRSVFVLSDDHRHHHNPDQPDRNFGFLFSFWDYWFRTSHRN